VKFIYLLSFLVLVACVSGKNEYVCGDRPCVDKKEFEEFFAKNLTIEILLDKKKKNKSLDLVKLNTNPENFKKENKKQSKQQEKLKKKTQKDKLKIEKNRLLEERKIKKAEKKIQAKERKLKSKQDKKIAKISGSKKKPKKINSNDKITNNESTIKTMESERKQQIKSLEVENRRSICDEIKDCDINTIAEKLIKKGKDKPFPNIASN